MRYLHLDCACGAAGDMLLAALCACGGKLSSVQAMVSRCLPDTVRLSVNPVMRSGISALHLTVEEGQTTSTETEHAHSHDHDHHHHHGQARHLQDMLHALHHAALPERAATRAEAALRMIAEAEAEIHQKPIESVHFHEISGVDTLVDIFGVCLLLDELQIERVSASAVAVGGGTVQCAHGRLPVPAPATQTILTRAKIPYHAGPVDAELLTPTGAALLAVLCDEFAPDSIRSADATGYGAGTQEFPGQPNVLRATMGRLAQPSTRERIQEWRFVVDDMTPEALAAMSEDLFAAGATECYLTPALMKKGRPGQEVTILLRPEAAPALRTVLLQSTTTLGWRCQEIERDVLPRREQTVKIDGLPVRVKVALNGEQAFRGKAEYEDCRRVQEATGETLDAIRRRAESAAMQESP